MATVSLNHAKQWIKNSDNPFAIILFRTLKSVRQFEVPAPRWVYGPVLALYTLVKNGIGGLMRVLFWTPMFKSQLQSCGKRLYLYGGLPYVAGPVKINLKDDCRISASTTITGRSVNQSQPVLNVGSNIDIGWMTTIAVGSTITFEDNVRIAGRAFFAGYPGHPLDATDRALGKPETDDQVGDITLCKDVWLATGVSVMAGVTIGAGTVVAAGSVVTKDLPPGVLAGGIPATVIKHLKITDSHQEDQL